MSKVNQIHINHPNLGEIVVHGAISKEINEQIGDVVIDCSIVPNYYHAEITKNEDGTFDLKAIGVIRPETRIIGWMKNSKGNKNFITVISNTKISEGITIYPSAILSVI